VPARDRVRVAFTELMLRLWRQSHAAPRDRPRSQHSTQQTRVGDGAERVPCAPPPGRGRPAPRPRTARKAMRVRRTSERGSW